MERYINHHYGTMDGKIDGASKDGIINCFTQRKECIWLCFYWKLLLLLPAKKKKKEKRKKFDWVLLIRVVCCDRNG